MIAKLRPAPTVGQQQAMLHAFLRAPCMEKRHECLPGIENAASRSAALKHRETLFCRKTFRRGGPGF
jgi:hypothetical protein